MMIPINKMVLKQPLHRLSDFLSTISFSTYPNEQFGIKKLLGRECAKKFFWGVRTPVLKHLKYRIDEFLSIYSSSGMSKETICEGI